MKKSELRHVTQNDPPPQSVCPMCQKPMKILKHTIICGCGSKINKMGVEHRPKGMRRTYANPYKHSKE